MKFRSLFVAVCLVLVPAVSFAAVPCWLGATAGVGMPFGDFSDVASTGFNLGFMGDYEFNDHLAAGGELGWQTYGGSDDFEKALTADAGTSVDVTVTAIPVMVHGKFMVPAGERSTAYAKAALGFYRTRVEFESSAGTADDSGTDFALGLGGGWNVKAGERMRYGVEGMFHFVSTEDSSTNILLARAFLMFGVGE